MAVEVTFGGGHKVKLKTPDADQLAHWLSTKSGQNPHVGDFLRIDAVEEGPILLYKESIAYMREVPD